MTIKYLVPTRHGNRVPGRRVEEGGLFPLQREMNRLFDDFFPGFGFPTLWEPEERALSRFSPKVNVSETDKEIKVSAELPGMDKDDINVELDDTALTIRGEKKEEHEEKEKDCYRREQCYGAFHRVVSLPTEVDANSAKAKFKKGVLTIALPKLEEDRSAKKTIEISVE